MPYAHLADVYDDIYTERVDYSGDVEFVLSTWSKYRNGSPNSLLDVGCGTGLLLAEFPIRISSMVGIDVCDEMLTVARKRLAHTHVKVQKCDVRTLQFRGDIPPSFSIETALFNFVNHLTTTKALSDFFRAMYDRLEVGGLLFFDFLNQTCALRSNPDALYETNLGRGVRVSMKIDFLSSTAIQKFSIGEETFNLCIALWSTGVLRGLASDNGFSIRALVQRKDLRSKVDPLTDRNVLCVCQKVV